MVPGKEKKRIQRLQLVAAVSLWITFLGAILLYLLFGWLNIWRPHTVWWWLTACLVVGSALASLALMLWQLPGEGRVRAMGVFLIATLPLAWFAAFLWSTIIAIDAREDLKLSTPIRSLGLWVGCYFELEARWRYPRITEGKHVQLFDDGSLSNVEQMVADMDRHIEEMSEVLDTPLPSTKVRWVRGSLFGQTGRAVGAWAICDTDEQELDYLDEHEVAHCVITMMCPVAQEMPMLLCEGWAQSQSYYQPMAILNLLRQKDSDDGALALDEIISNSYGSSTGPAYQYGGPFASYLIERFGGAKFVELYGGVRRATFRQDVDCILGVTWDQLESDFWTWLESRREWANATQASEAEESLFEVEREVDAQRWREILNTVRKAEKEFSYPSEVAFEVRRKGSTWREKGSIFISNDRVWAIHDEASNSHSSRRIQIATPELCGHFIEENGNIRQSENYSTSNNKQEADYLKSFWFRRNSLSGVMMVDLTDLSPDHERRYKIQRIEPTAKPDLWNFDFSEIYESTPDNNRHVETIIDRSRNFDVVEIPSEVQRDVARKHHFEFGLIRGTDVLTNWTSIDAEGNRFETKLTELSAEEADELREKVESTVAKAEKSELQASLNVSEFNEPIPWAQWLVNPTALAIAWPAMGLLFLMVDMVCDRFKWRAT